MFPCIFLQYQTAGNNLRVDLDMFLSTNRINNKICFPKNE